MTYFDNVSEFIVALNIARGVYAEMVGSYDSDIAAYAEQGYGPHYCIHGTDLWVEYDNICAGCENGVTFANMAAQFAYGQVVEARRRMNVATTILSLSRADRDYLGLDGEFAERAVNWAMEPTKLN